MKVEWVDILEHGVPDHNNKVFIYDPKNEHLYDIRVDSQFGDYWWLSSIDEFDPTHYAEIPKDIKWKSIDILSDDERVFLEKPWKMNQIQIYKIYQHVVNWAEKSVRGLLLGPEEYWSH